MRRDFQERLYDEAEAIQQDREKKMSTIIVWNPLVGRRPFALLVNGVMQRLYSRDELKKLDPAYDEAAGKAIISMESEEVKIVS